MNRHKILLLFILLSKMCFSENARGVSLWGFYSVVPYTPHIGFPSRSYQPTLGLRFDVSHPIALDFGFGVTFESSVKEDTLRDQINQFPQINFSIVSGLCIQIAKRENSSLAFRGLIVASLQKWYDEKYVNGYNITKGYYTLSPSLHLGFEPSLHISRNIALFGFLGFEFLYIPPSQYIDTDSNNSLGKRDDGVFAFRTDIFNLGIRFIF